MTYHIHVIASRRFCSSLAPAARAGVAAWQSPVNYLAKQGIASAHLSWYGLNRTGQGKPPRNDIRLGESGTFR